MYGLLQCRTCKRPRIIDLSQKSSACPYCNSQEKTKDARIVYRTADQESAREALTMATGFVPPKMSKEKKQKEIEAADPYSTMVYRFEHASDLDEKMIILAEGLTECKGTFTLDDVREVVGVKNAEKYVSAMLDRCYISEVRIGQYKG